MSLRLINDGELCNGHLTCCAVAPDLLSVDEVDAWSVAIKGQTIEVPPELREQAERAEALCPEEAYSLVETDQ